jgi:hypothetical protein
MSRTLFGTLLALIGCDGALWESVYKLFTRREKQLVTTIRKEKQVSFRVDSGVAARIEEATTREELREADFVRKLFVWSLEHYEDAGSLFELKRRNTFATLVDEDVATGNKVFARKGAGKSTRMVVRNR